MAVEAQGESAAAGGWLAAWRGRRDNPLARADCWREKGERSYRQMPVSVGLTLILCSITATCLIFQAYLHFKALASSACISRAYALNTLLWALTTMLDYAVVVCYVWLLQHVSCAYRACCGFLTRQPGWGRRLSPELAASPLSDTAVVTGAGMYALRVVGGPLLLLAIISAVDQLAGVCAKHQDALFAAGSAGWPGAPWLWALLAAVLIAAIKVACGALVVLAGVWALLCFSAYWRHPALPAIAWVGGVMGQLLCLLVGWPGNHPFYASGNDWLAEVFRTPAPVILLGAGLLLLALESQLWHGTRARARLARFHFGAVRTLLACGLLVGLLLWVGLFIDYDTLFWQSTGAQKQLPGLWALAPGIGWPLQAASISCPIPALEDAFSQPGAAAPVLFKLIALRALMLLGFPLLLCVIFGGHARSAVWLARRGAA
jgi:hypothetical protein